MSNQEGSKEEALHKLKSLVEEIGVAMFTTYSSDGDLTSRPMAVQKIEGENIWFFARRNSGKMFSISKHHQVNLGFSSTKDSSFVSIAGRAQIVDDRDKIRELWSKAAEAFLPEGPEDPNVVLIRVVMESAEYWDAPSSQAVQLLGMLKSVAKNQAYRPGQNERVDLH